MPALDSAGLSDWITAGATVATAIATAFGGLGAWFIYRRDKARDLPIIEANISWHENAYLEARILIRNRLSESILINDLEITQPKGATISEGQDGELRSPKTRPTTRKVPSEWEIPDPDSRTYLSSRPIFPIELFVYPPTGWQSGTVALTFRISSKTRTIRERRQTIKQFVKAPTIKQIDPSAIQPG